MIIFQNAGLIDINAITTMGVSVKEAGSIGYFGTGLKFAIATILRNNCSITIYCGLEAYTFEKEVIEVRGESFDRVTMNGQSMGFTTNLGRDWEPWMAFRELASNCKDEAGHYWRDDQASTSALPLAGQTTITVSGEAFSDVWNDRETIMLERPPILSNEHIEIRNGSSSFVYYRGVRIYRASKPLHLTYNILSKIDLTEDRTAKSWWEIELALERGIGQIEDEALLRKILTCGEGYQEHSLRVGKFGDPKEHFRKVARELALGSSTEKNANPDAVRTARATVVEDMIATGGQGSEMELTQSQAKMLTKATSMLEAVGFKVSEFPIIVCKNLGPAIHGLAKNGHIFLSVLPFEKGTREVAATILEEFAHLKSGEDDCTRGFQNWLFDQILCQAEEKTGEPF